MKLLEPKNANYAAVVIEIKSIIELENCDNVVAVSLLGFHAIVSKDTKIGDVGIVFPAECQLSDEFVSENCLYRHGDRNIDPSAKGYLEDNRRVKAMKFRGNRSDCLFMPLSSLKYTKEKIAELKVGDVFDQLGDHEICKKYTVKTRTSNNRLEKNKKKVWNRVDTKFFPLHVDTDNYWRNKDALKDHMDVVVTAKIHGTSVRISNNIVAKKSSIIDKVAKLFGANIQTHEYDMVYGSRKVTKDANRPDQQHYYDSDIWTLVGKRLDGILPQGWMVFGEIVGWVGEETPIQKNYTYQLPQGSNELYIYRIVQVNPQGRITDLAWDQVVEFCRDNNLKTVPELWRGKHKDFVAEDWIDKKFFEEGYVNCLPLDKESPCDEGVCVRVDGLVPYLLKAKSPDFLGYESKMLDEEAIDIEEEGKIEEV
jgi:hypothetical protein